MAVKTEVKRLVRGTAARGIAALPMTPAGRAARTREIPDAQAK